MEITSSWKGEVPLIPSKIKFYPGYPVKSLCLKVSAKVNVLC